MHCTFAHMARLRTISRAALLMILSQLLLLAFVSHWLCSQYKQEKEELKKTISHQFAETQRQVLDSVLLTRLIDPLLNNEAMRSQFRDSLQKPVFTDSSHFSIEINIDSTDLNTGKKKVIASSRYSEKLSLRKPGDMRETVRFRSRGDEKKEGVFIRMESDTPNAMLLQGVRLILDQVHGGAGLKTSLSLVDTTLFKKLFIQHLRENHFDFDTTWLQGEQVKKAGSPPLYFESTLFPKPYGVAISNYSLYLFREILPQLVFCLVLMMLTSFAFWQAYISYKRQVRLGLLKDDLISNMSHELKTPVSTVKVALEALKDERVIDNRQMTEEYIDMATTELNRLDDLMSRVLNSSVLESNAGHLRPERFSMEALVEEVVSTMKIRLDRSLARVVVEHSGKSLMVRGDKVHLQGVILNLIDNSLKYGGEGVEIRISLSREEDFVVLFVADNGPGIPEEYVSRVFDKFFRVPTGNLHNTKGFGLGLSYAAQVIKLHKGTIEAKNRAGGGCVFKIRIPAAK